MLRSTLIYTTVFTAFFITLSSSPVLAAPSPNAADRQPPSRNIDIDFLDRIIRDGTDDQYKPRYNEKIYQLAQQQRVATSDQDTTDTSFLNDTEEEERLDEQEDVNIFDAQKGTSRIRRPLTTQAEEGEEAFEKLEKEKWEAPSNSADDINDEEDDSRDSPRRAGRGKARLASEVGVTEADDLPYMFSDPDEWEDLPDDLEGAVPIRRSARGTRD